MSTNHSKAILWIGFANVRPKPGTDALHECVGAYVNVLGRAMSPTEFQVLAKKALEDVDLLLVSLEDIENFSVRMEKQRVSSKLKEIAEQVAEVGDIRFDTFEAYAHEDEPPAHS